MSDIENLFGANAKAVKMSDIDSMFPLQSKTDRQPFRGDINADFEPEKETPIRFQQTINRTSPSTGAFVNDEGFTVKGQRPTTKVQEQFDRIAQKPGTPEFELVQDVQRRRLAESHTDVPISATRGTASYNLGEIARNVSALTDPTSPESIIGRQPITSGWREGGKNITEGLHEIRQKFIPDIVRDDEGNYVAVQPDKRPNLIHGLAKVALGTGEALFGTAVSATPAGLAFNLGTQGLEQVSPRQAEAVGAAMSPIQYFTNRYGVKMNNDQETTAKLGDLVWQLLLLKGVHQVVAKGIQVKIAQNEPLSPEQERIVARNIKAKDVQSVEPTRAEDLPKVQPPARTTGEPAQQTPSKAVEPTTLPPPTSTEGIVAPQKPVEPLKPAEPTQTTTEGQPTPITQPEKISSTPASEFYKTQIGKEAPDQSVVPEQYRDRVVFTGSDKGRDGVPLNYRFQDITNRADFQVSDLKDFESEYKKVEGVPKEQTPGRSEELQSAIYFLENNPISREDVGMYMGNPEKSSGGRETEPPQGIPYSIWKQAWESNPEVRIIEGRSRQTSKTAFSGKAADYKFTKPTPVQKAEMTKAAFGVDSTIPITEQSFRDRLSKEGGVIVGESETTAGKVIEYRLKDDPQQHTPRVATVFKNGEMVSGRMGEPIGKSKTIGGIDDYDKFKSLIEKKYGSKIVDTEHRNDGYSYLVLENGGKVKVDVTEPKVTSLFKHKKGIPGQIFSPTSRGKAKYGEMGYEPPPPPKASTGGVEKVKRQDIDRAASEYQSALKQYGENNQATIRAEIRYRDLQKQYDAQKTKPAKPPTPLTPSKLQEAKEAAPKAGMTPKQQKGAILDDLKKAKSIIDPLLRKFERDKGLTEPLAENIAELRRLENKMSLSGKEHKRRDVLRKLTRDYRKLHEEEFADKARPEEPGRLRYEVVDRNGQPQDAFPTRELAEQSATDMGRGFRVVDLRSEREFSKVHSVPITPEMRKTALGEGFQLFSSIIPGITDKQVQNILKKTAEAKPLITSTREAVEDNWIRVKKLIEETGGNIEKGDNPYLIHELMPGRIQAQMEKHIERADEIVKDITKSAKDKGVESKKLNQMVDEYLIAKHTPERNAALNQTKSTGMTDADAVQKIRELQNTPHWEDIKRIAGDIRELDQKGLKILLDGQVISQDFYDKLNDRYKEHVSLYRVLEDQDVADYLNERGLGVRSTGVKSAVGSELPVKDILGNTLENLAKFTVRAEKNRVDLATLEFARKNKDIGLFEEERPQAIGVKFGVEGKPEGKDLVFKYPQGKNILPLRENGKPVFLRINDTKLAAALQGVNDTAIPGLLKGIAQITRLYSSLATRWNPDFPIGNKIRDLQELLVSVSAQHQLGFGEAIKTVAKDLTGKNMLAVFDWLRGKDTEGAKLYEQMRNDGGTTGGMGLSTRKAIDIDLDKIRTLAQSKPRQAVSTLLQYVDNVNQIAEDSSRLGVYREALDRGLSRNEAAWQAKNATINFNRHGTSGPLVNALWMFSNASMQGSVKMLRAMKNPKVAGTTVTAVFAAVYLASKHNDSIDPDWRDKVSPYDRMSALPIVLGKNPDGTLNYLAFPVSWGLKPINATASELIDAMSGKNESIGESASKIAAATIDSYNPLGGTDILSAMTPTIGDVPVELARNKKWSGGMIRPDWMKQYPAHQVYFKDFGNRPGEKIAIKIAKGASEYGIEVSPQDLKYVFDQYIGGTGRFAQRVYTTGKAVATGETPPVPEYPFVGRFIRTDRGKSGGDLQVINTLEKKVEQLKIKALETQNVNDISKYHQALESLHLLRQESEAYKTQQLLQKENAERKRSVLQEE